MKKLILGSQLLDKFNLLVYFVFCTIGIGMVFYPTFQSGFAFTQTDPGDPWLVNYFLEHSFQMLVNPDYQGELWSPTFFYPYKNVLAFSENLFGSAPVYWLLRAFFTSDLAYQLWMIAVCILNFFSFAFLMRKFRVSHVLSAFGAFIFAFSMARVGQLSHPQLLPQFFTPFVFLASWEFIKQPSRKRLALLLLLTYLQVLSGIYLGWFLLLSLLIFFGITYKLYPEALAKLIAYWRSNYRATISIILGWLVLMILTLLPYLEAKSVFGRRPYSEIDSMLPRISSWFSVPPNSLWSSVLAWVSKDLPMGHEHHMFAGFTVILLTGLCIHTLIYRKSILNFERIWLVKICLLVFITIFCLSLRLPLGISLWRIVYELIPGASVIRGVTRIWTISYFYLLIAIIISLDSFLNTVIVNKRSYLLIVSIVCFVGISEQLVLNIPSYVKAPYVQKASELHQLIQKDCDVAYLSFNPNPRFYEDQLTAMWAGIQANIAVVNGHSGNVPPHYGDSTKAMNTSQVVDWLESLKTPEKKLCMISSRSLGNQDTILKYAIQEKISSSGNFISYTIPLPFPKIFAQKIKFFEIPKRVKTSEVFNLPVFVKNTSNFLWSNEGDHPTNFSYRWIDAKGNLAIFDGDGDRTALPLNLQPGESVALNAAVRAPIVPGKYKLILTMVQENVTWFNDQLTNNPEISMDVIYP
jgi:hypothetical protein